MNRNQLVTAVVASTHLPADEVRTCLDGLLGTRESAGVLVQVLCAGDKIQLAGFGTLEVRQRPERSGHNPRTGERIRISASVTAVFRPATMFRQRLTSALYSRQPGPAGAA